MKSLKTIIITTFTLALVFCVTAARANVTQIKAYKEAYPDTKPKCIDCHVDKIPKKEDGRHDPSDYGKAVIKEAGKEKPTAATYTKIGKIEDFKK